MTTAAIVGLILATESDPITAFLERDWAALGGWSLFLSLAMLIVIGAFREWWVPGVRYRRLELSAEKQSETLAVTVKVMEQQVTANEIVKHFFEETTPRRREVEDNEETRKTAPPRRPGRPR